MIKTQKKKKTKVKKKRRKKTTKESISSFGFYVKTNLKDIKRRKISYCLAVLSCAIVVTSTIVS